METTIIDIFIGSALAFLMFFIVYFITNVFIYLVELLIKQFKKK
jgi:hypothetical protein